MLEALQDIEIASRLVGFDVDSDDSLDEKYKKLCCNIAPLPHDSEDYQLIEKYLHNTHAPTHTVSFQIRSFFFFFFLSVCGGWGFVACVLQVLRSNTDCLWYPQEWSLELEEVFSLEREGEFDKFAPYRQKLKNKMLLWHGKLQLIYMRLKEKKSLH